MLPTPIRRPIMLPTTLAVRLTSREKKALFQTACLRTMTPSQLVRGLVRQFLAEADVDPAPRCDKEQQA
jgi:hypothetical protein